MTGEAFTVSNKPNILVIMSDEHDPGVTACYGDSIWIPEKPERQYWNIFKETLARLISHNEQGVTFNWKDYRTKSVRYKPMTLATYEFIRRFLIHVLPKGFHRIRHYGLLASHVRRKNLIRLRVALDVYEPELQEGTPEKSAPFVCRSCGKPLRIIETLNPKPRAPP